MLKLSAAESRALALNAAGIDSQVRDFNQTLEKLGLFQIDSVNVFQRAHLMPAFSRMGSFDQEEFESWAFGAGELRAVEEYWAHCAALIPKEDYALFEFRRNYYRTREKVASALNEHKSLAKWIVKEIENNGPMVVRDFEHEQNKRKGDWWGWSDVKGVLERLWFIGELVSDGRIQFSRRYALPNQTSIRSTTELSEQEQKRRLIELSAIRLGVGTLEDIADYYRFYPSEARPFVSELVSNGTIIEVEVEGWTKPAFIHKDTEPVQRLSLGERELRLLSPFDPVVWKRDRAKRLFNFDYLIEIYVPEAKRTYGYYTLPILYQDQLVGRVDLKHERKQKTLSLLSLWHEPWLNRAQLSEIKPRLIKELRLAANWIGAEKINPPQKGNWALGRI